MNSSCLSTPCYRYLASKGMSVIGKTNQWYSTSSFILHFSYRLFSAYVSDHASAKFLYQLGHRFEVSESVPHCARYYALVRNGKFYFIFFTSSVPAVGLPQHSGGQPLCQLRRSTGFADKCIYSPWFHRLHLQYQQGRHENVSTFVSRFERDLELWNNTRCQNICERLCHVLAVWLYPSPS